MKAIFTLLATTAVAAATSLSGRTGQEPTLPAAPALAPGVLTPGVPMLAGVPMIGSLFTQSAPRAVNEVAAPVPVPGDLFRAQAALGAPSQKVPLMPAVPVLGDLFTRSATTPEAQEPTPAPPATRARRRAPSADDERAQELDRLKARLAELERELAERERAETAQTRQHDRARAEAMSGDAKTRMKSVEKARAEALEAAERTRGMAQDLRAAAESARQAAEEARQQAQRTRAEALEARAQADKTRARGLETLGQLGYIDTHSEDEAEQGEWQQLKDDLRALERNLVGLEKGKLKVAREQLEKARVQLQGQMQAGPLTEETRAQLEARLEQGALVDPRPLFAPRTALKPPTAPSAPRAAEAPAAPRPGTPRAPGRAGTLRKMTAPEAGMPGLPGIQSTPRAGADPGTGSGGPIHIHVENGDVHIHNGGGGARISVEGKNPFSVDTTRSQGDKDRVSGVFAPGAVNEESARTKGSLTFGRSFDVGDLRKAFSGDDQWLTVSPPADAHTQYWRGLGDAFKVDGEACANVYYGIVDGDDAFMTWSPEQFAAVQQAYTAVLPQATADAVRAYTVYAPSAVGQPSASASSATSAPEGALEELLRLVREVHADVRALRTEMQTLRGEVEQAPETIGAVLEILFKGF